MSAPQTGTASNPQQGQLSGCAESPIHANAVKCVNGELRLSSIGFGRSATNIDSEMED